MPMLYEELFLHLKKTQPLEDSMLEVWCSARSLSSKITGTSCILLCKYMYLFKITNRHKPYTLLQVHVQELGSFGSFRPQGSD